MRSAPTWKTATRTRHAATTSAWTCRRTSTTAAPARRNASTLSRAAEAAASTRITTRGTVEAATNRARKASIASTVSATMPDSFYKPVR